MNPLPLILGAAAIAALLISSRASGGASVPQDQGGGAPTGSWCDFSRDQSRSLARAFATELANRYGINGLPVYLDAVGYWESRWNPCATGDSGGVSKGMYQMRAGTVFRTSNGLTYLQPRWPQLFTDGKLAVILAADYAMRAGTRLLQNGRTPYWLAVRRWWKYPAAVHDHNETKYDSSPGVRARFTEALKAIGVDPQFMYSTFNPNGWPGAKQVMREYGYASLVK